MPHTFDALGWCKTCGAGQADIEQGLRAPECEAGVVGISHLVRGGALQALMDAIIWNLAGYPGIQAGEQCEIGPWPPPRRLT